MNPTGHTLPEPVAPPAIIFSHGHHAAKQAQHPYLTFFRTVIAPRFTLFYLLFAIILMSQVAFILHPVLGVYATFAALVSCIAIALRHESIRKLAVSVGIIPAATIVTMCLPQGSTFATMVVFYDVLLILSLVYRYMFMTSEPKEDRGLRATGYLKSIPTMLVLGQLLGGLAYIALRDHYAYSDMSFGLVAASAAIFAIAEESFFRGLIQQRAGKVFHPIMGAVLSTLLFATLSLGQGNLLSAGVALVTGAVLSTVYYHKQNV
ncbi:MAG TPA: CPBP family intramembrane glutamic endopeptidase, partial [Candidatus Saccharimonadales bacterium]|nr:CPBP family intramembrane glutamic endopeptidase [Candidatus Saccharimonadales bacterium]